MRTPDAPDTSAAGLENPVAQEAPAEGAAPGPPAVDAEGLSPDEARDLSPAGLDKRLSRLERLADLMDLLAIPGLLAGGASKMFSSAFNAADMPSESRGVFPLERSPSGVMFRWFRFPAGCEVRVPVIGGLPSLLKVVTLGMGHLKSPEDFVFKAPEGVVVTPLGLERNDDGTIAMLARVRTGRTRLCGIIATSRSKLQTGSGDTRSLGLPFVRAEYWPDL